MKTKKTAAKKQKGGKRYVSVRLDVELLMQISQEAGRQKRKTAQLIRNMIEERFEQMQSPGTVIR